MQSRTSATTQAIVIRDITELAEMRELENLQREVWGVEDIDVLPALAIRPQVEVGAILIGAFSNNEVVGFVFGFPGIVSGQTIIHSDMLAVKPQFRRFGLGYLLKLAQRERAIEQGISCITWTYDPLQLRNANLNFARLGVTSKRYMIDFYGETTSFLHSFGTDRLWVEWLLNSDRVKDRIDSNAKPPLTSVELEQIPALVRVGEDEQPVVTEEVGLGTSALIEIPADINSLVSRDDGSAQRWRKATRQAFTKLMTSGFEVEEFFVVEKDSKTLGAYLLTKPFINASEPE